VLVALVSLASLLGATGCAACADPGPSEGPRAAASVDGAGTATTAPRSSSSPGASAVSSTSSPALAAPYDALGPLRVGMSEAEARAALPSLQPGPIPSWLVADGYEVRVVDGRVKTVRAELAEVGGLTVHGKTLGPSASFDDAVAAFAGCGPEDVREGGTLVRCEGGAVTLLAGGVSRVVYVGVGE
jgi:hypothetical protein